MRGLLGFFGALLVGFSVAFVGVLTCPYMGKIVARVMDHKCNCANCSCANKCLPPK